MANGWLMRPGSSVLELTMHQFEEGFPHEQYAKRNMLASIHTPLNLLLVPCLPSQFAATSDIATTAAAAAAAAAGGCLLGAAVLSGLFGTPPAVHVMLAAGCRHAGAVLESAAVR